MKEREYRNYVKNGIEKDRKATAQLNAMKKLRTLFTTNGERIAKALAEYLSKNKYSKIIRLEIEDTKKQFDNVSKAAEDNKKEEEKKANEETEQNSSKNILNEIMK